MLSLDRRLYWSWKTIKEGGAVYDFISGLQVGIANMADSLAAIKNLSLKKRKLRLKNYGMRF